MAACVWQLVRQMYCIGSLAIFICICICIYIYIYIYIYIIRFSGPILIYRRKYRAGQLRDLTSPLWNNTSYNRAIHRIHFICISQQYSNHRHYIWCWTFNWQTINTPATEIHIKHLQIIPPASFVMHYIWWVDNRHLVLHVIGPNNNQLKCQ